jgi:tetratricopeptide (TPR) repeat protein
MGKNKRTEAVIWFRKSAEQGYAPAQAQLGRCYVLGDGVDKNIDEAIKWLRRAVDQGERGSAEALAEVLFNRGVAYGEAGDTAKKMADYTAVIGMKDAPAEQKAKALYNRGVTHGKAGDTAKEMADYTAVIGMKDAPAEQKANALYNRGVTHGKAGDTAKALADYTAVIAMKDVPAEQKAEALYNRGVTYGKAGDAAKETADYTAVIAMKDAPAEQKAKAKEAAARTWYAKAGYARRQKDYQEALRLYSKVIDLDENYLNAYGMRGMTYSLDGQHQKAIDDFSRGIKLKPGNNAGYYDKRGEAYYALGKFADASRDALKACELGKCELRDQMRKAGKLTQ